MERASSIPKERIVGTVQPNILCSNCDKLPLIPKSCFQCNQALCGDCTQTPTCPKCQTQSQFAELPPQFFEMVYGTVRVYCLYKGEGCKDELLIKDILSHEQMCNYEGKLCKYCWIKVAKFMIDEHLAICDLGLEECRNCGENVVREKKEAHNCISTLKSRIEEINGTMKEELEMKISIQEHKIAGMEKLINVLWPKCVVCDKKAIYLCSNKPNARKRYQNGCLQRYSCEEHSYHKSTECKRTTQKGEPCRCDHDCRTNTEYCGTIKEFGIKDQ